MTLTSLIRRLTATAIIAALAVVAVPAVAGAADPSLSNTYTVGQIKLNKKHGSAKISVTVPLAGIAAIGANDEHSASQTRSKGPGVLVLKLRPRGAFLKHLKQAGKAEIKFNISFTPDGGVTNTESHKLVLKLKKK